MTAKDVLELVLVTQYFDTMKDIGVQSRAKTIFVPNNPGALSDITGEIRSGFRSGFWCGFLSGFWSGFWKRAPKSRGEKRS